MEKRIEVNSTVKQNKHINVTDCDGEKAMLSMKSEKYFIMNKIGSRIWDMISEPITVNDVILKLINEYHLDYNHCEEIVLEFLNLLDKEDIVVKVDTIRQ
ncbi:lasso peptide biosynthesis PqqD family chaperone [Clostridium oryzae]|uniref:Coenzyme PQQ synthesis protein D n=1 Tax=Clostridium oryzae TaxID=1450648 RepID=A0A1V4IYZ9_9CLOT|nr:lasso peptide biosynthesis PqqD family chaperone [Clostridium oryzae]OPJ65050.1 hypothetical protein CLORY_00500 [Clostridium oryzae]